MEVGAVGVVAQIKIADHDSLFECDTCSLKRRRSRRVAAAPHPAHLSAGGRPWRRGGEPQGPSAHLPAAAKKKKISHKGVIVALLLSTSSLTKRIRPRGDASHSSPTVERDCLRPDEMRLY